MRQRRRSCLLAVFVAVLAMTGIQRARADDLPMLLDVSVNNQPLDLIGNFTLKNGVLFATPKEWRSLGLVVPDTASAEKLIPMTDLPGVSGRIDQRLQTLAVTADPEALIPHELNVRSDETSTHIDHSGVGAVINYNILATHAGVQTIGSGLFDARLYGPDGVLDSSEIASTAPGSNNFVRLDTTYTYSDPGHLRRFLAGDVLTSGLAWTRTLRLAGFQFASDFGLQPNLVTFPVPSIRGSAAVPSTVDLLVNGVREFSQPVPAGAFELRQIPVVTGASNVSLVVRNAVGQETIESLPFYTSSNLLSSGLTSYGGEVGFVRRNYGFLSNDYGIPAMNGSVRHGFNNWLTGEAHVEATRGLGLGGVGASVKLGDFGIISGAGAISGAGHSGLLYSLGFEHQSNGISVNFSATRTSSGYMDTADVSGDLSQKSVIQAGIGFSLGRRLGFVGVSYNAVTYYGHPVETFDDLGVVTAPGNARIASATYSVELPGSIALYATGFDDIGEHGSYGMTIGISVPLGRRTSVGGYVSDQGKSATYGLQASQSAIDIGDFGWNVNLTQGPLAQRQGEVDYKTSWNEASLAANQTDGSFGERVGLTGSLVAAGGGVFAANSINDSFAVARTGDLSGIPILRENRIVGKTDSAGRLLITDLRAYEDNVVAVDPLSLPLDAQAGELSRIVRPADRSGVLVDFVIKRGSAARISFVDANGGQLPVGTMINVEGAQTQAPVGFDGTTYLTDLPASGILDAALPDGGLCSANFKFIAREGQIPLIGPLTCR